VIREEGNVGFAEVIEDPALAKAIKEGELTDSVMKPTDLARKK
jgi:hypothetical protein